jgi:hypothetical protein
MVSAAAISCCHHAHTQKTTTLKYVKMRKVGLCPTRPLAQSHAAQHALFCKNAAQRGASACLMQLESQQTAVRSVLSNLM